MGIRRPWLVATLAVALLSACVEGTGRRAESSAQSCMGCHNGSQHNDYSGPGIEDPHPFGDAANLACTVCHGGNPSGEGEQESHIPPPPEIGDRENLANNRQAYFNRLTLTGIDKFEPYEINGIVYHPVDYLQFINPGDLRVTQQGRSCGQCHQTHSDSVSRSLIATSAGVFSGATFAIGVDNRVPISQGRWEDTAADTGFRAVYDSDWDTSQMGTVSRLEEFPVFSVRGEEGEDLIFRNPLYASDLLPNGQEADNQVITDSPLADLYHEQIAFTCGDCHLGSAGANNRYGDFRSSGCTACHMPYSLDGRSRTGDPNVDREEPEDPDQIRRPERSHPRRHLIQSIAKTLPGGEMVPGIDDYACAGCHQGSNRTVMQYWGIRLDQNEDLRNDVQYPANPVSYVNTRDDERLFDPEVDNRTFNGRDRDQYILFEDYDGDGRDDTPADVHYEAGMGCIDCHGSHDLHGSGVSQGDEKIHSRMEQAVAIRCESCHGTAEEYAETRQGLNYDGEQATLAVDSEGNLLRHVEVEADGSYWMTSRLTGERHYVRQTKDTIVDSGAVHPDTNDPVWRAIASYAMGRADGNDGTGIGPMQNSGPSGFSHMESVSCVACHAAWTNTCIGCHLGGEYDEGNNFSNITGERIVFEQANADFVYQSPVPFQLGVGVDDKIGPLVPNTDVFWEYEDLNNLRSRRFAFSDRKGLGANRLASDAPSLSHNAMMPHSIRGRVTGTNEGVRQCTSCHLTDGGLANWGTEYDAFRTAMAAKDYGALDFELLKTHIGLNPGNQLNSPIWVHMVAGLGSGLFLFDDDGGAVNPLDDNAERVGSDNVAPADDFDPGRVVYDLDRVVEPNGVTNASNNHPMADGEDSVLRDGANDPRMAGPLGMSLIQRLTDPVTGIVLDSWFDADGLPRGGAGAHLSGN